MPCQILFYADWNIYDEVAEEKYNDWEEGYIYSYYVAKRTIMNKT